MPLERIFLGICVLGFILYCLMLATAFIAMWPWGILGLLVLAFVVYVAWRLVSEHTRSAEDRYYEDNFDK